MFGMVKRMTARTVDLSEVESWLVGSSLRFAAEITSEFKEVPQFLAASEGLSFFLHALRREVFRPGEFKIWDSVFEPARKQMVRVFAMALAGWSGSDLDHGTLIRDVEGLTSLRNLEYQTVPFLAGAIEDRQTVIHIGSRRLAEAVDPARRDALMAAVHRIRSRVASGELPEQARQLQEKLYGRHAA